MFAWMNKESLKQTLMTKRMTYWSRSRQSLWVKGETSGHIQKLVSMVFDCDAVVLTILIQVRGLTCVSLTYSV
ncbi:MAG: phosphoribosyl-AMP cyclohydrolase [Cellvibrionaceae bacterium]|jgi:phosphoribosyl-AMP cyclohydrolase